jgi:hypothetical protein
MNGDSCENGSECDYDGNTALIRCENKKLDEHNIDA